MNAILYAAKTKLSAAHQPISVWDDGVLVWGDGDGSAVIYVRAEVKPVFAADGDDLSATLDRAKARKGETILNAIEL